jgi:YidC/Oxa1 family membrane protein insertase
MKFAQATKYLLLVGASQAFAPVHRFSSSRIAGATSARSMAVDPHFFNDIPNHMQSLQDAFSSISLSDAMPDADAVAAIGDEVAKSDNGWFGFLEGPIELLLQGIHSMLVSVGMSANAWGLTIIAMTIFIKLATFPLTKTQLESTNKMQVS